MAAIDMLKPWRRAAGAPARRSRPAPGGSACHGLPANRPAPAAAATETPESIAAAVAIPAAVAAPAVKIPATTPAITTIPATIYFHT